LRNQSTISLASVTMCIIVGCCHEHSVCLSSACCLIAY